MQNVKEMEMRIKRVVVGEEAFSGPKMVKIFILCHKPRTLLGKKIELDKCESNVC